MGPASPSSQRLPSPPPFPEVQIGPKSPGITNPGDATMEAEDTAKYDQQAVRRIRPGTKAAEMAVGPPLVPLSEVSEYAKSIEFNSLIVDAPNTFIARLAISASGARDSSLVPSHPS